MTGNAFLEQYTALLREIKPILYGYARNLAKYFDAPAPAESFYTYSPDAYLFMELSQALSQLINTQRELLILVPRGAGYRALQGIVDSAYDIPRLCASIVVRSPEGGCRDNLEQCMEKCLDLLGNLVIEETHEQEKQTCYAKSSVGPEILFVYLQWEETSKLFLEIFNRSMQRWESKNTKTWFWEWDRKRGYGQIQFVPEELLSLRMDWAIVLAKKGEYGAAYSRFHEIVYGAVVADNDFLARPFQNLAAALHNRGDFAEALNRSRDALQFCRNQEQQAWILSSMADTFLCMEQWTDAVAYADHALAVDAENTFAVFVKVKGMFHLNRFDELRDLLPEILNLYEKRPTPELAYSAGYILYLKHDFPAACKYMKEYYEHGTDSKQDWSFISNYAPALYYAHDTSAAWFYMRKYIAHCEESGDKGERATYHLTIFYYYLDSPYFDRVIRSAEEYRERYEESEEIDFLTALMEIDDSVAEEWERLWEAIEHERENYNPAELEKRIDWLKSERQKWKNWIETLPRQMLDADTSSLSRKLFVSSYLFESGLLLRAERMEEALEQCDKGLAWDLSNSELLYNKAQILRNMNRDSAVLPLYYKALEFQENPERRQMIQSCIAQLRETNHDI